MFSGLHEYVKKKKKKIKFFKNYFQLLSKNSLNVSKIKLLMNR